MVPSEVSQHDPLTFYDLRESIMPNMTNSTHPTSPADAPEFAPQHPISSGVAVLRAVLLAPRTFFLNFSEEGPLQGPVIFIMLVTAVTAALRLALTLIFGSNDLGSVGVSMLQALAFILLSPVLVGAFAGAYLLSVRTFVGKVGTFWGVYRMLAYAYGAMILFWVPVLNAFAFAYATLVLMVIGIRYVYRTSLLTALITGLVAYIPAALAFILLQVWVTGIAFH